jgi:hypothetical protein
MSTILGALALILIVTVVLLFVGWLQNSVDQHNISEGIKRAKRDD